MAAVSIREATVQEPAGELADLRFRALLPAEAWAALPLAVRRRFSKRMTGGATVTYRGAVAAVRANVAGRLLALAARLIGGPLPLVYEPGASVVTVTEDQVGQGQIWTRLYARRGGFPQVIHSAKRFAGSTGLEEHIGAGVGMALTASVEGEALVFRSAFYFVARPSPAPASLGRTGSADDRAQGPRRRRFRLHPCPRSPMVWPSARSGCDLQGCMR
jgi:hypothetical protein